jgi:hypothetical protein
MRGEEAGWSINSNLDEDEFGKKYFKLCDHWFQVFLFYYIYLWIFQNIPVPLIEGKAN